MASLQGQLLIASPNQPDADLVKTVILLIQHSEQQAVGVVLNRPTDTTIKELFEKAYFGDQHIYSGGPVPCPLMAVHTCEPLGEMEILAGVYSSVKRKNLDKIVREPDRPLRIFDGHAGWGPGQLEQQIERGGWKVTPATIEYVLYDSGDLWERLAVFS